MRPELAASLNAADEKIRVSRLTHGFCLRAAPPQPLVVAVKTPAGPDGAASPGS